MRREAGGRRRTVTDATQLRERTRRCGSGCPGSADHHLHRARRGDTELGRFGRRLCHRPAHGVEPTLPFLTAPIVHHGQRLGAIYLAGRDEGQVFSAEDQDVFETFVSQASMVIASARRYDERRARLDMETLFPGVFDARAGRPVSINREWRLLRGLGGLNAQGPAYRWTGGEAIARRSASRPARSTPTS